MNSNQSDAPLGPRIAFVTGATGLLGNNLVRLLLARGFKVRALARSAAKAASQFDGLGVEVVQGDMGDVSGFARALLGAEVVFHTAAHFRDSYKGGSHGEELMRINVVGTRELIAAAHLAGIRRFVHTSSIAVLDGPRGAVIDETMLRREEDADDYYRSKILADRQVLRFLESHPEMWAAFVLPAWMHGPGDIGPTSAGQMTLDFLKGKLPGIIPATFSLVDARDVAEALLAAFERGRRGERYLAAGRNLSLAELAGYLERASGVPAPRWRIPLALLFAIAGLEEARARLMRRPALLSWASARLLARESGRTTFSAVKCERELGIRFRPIEETIRDEVAWYRDHGWVPVQPGRPTPAGPDSLSQAARGTR